MMDLRAINDDSRRLEADLADLADLWTIFELLLLSCGCRPKGMHVVSEDDTAHMTAHACA